MAKKQIITDYESFKDIKGVQICEGDKIHTSYHTYNSNHYICEATVEEIRGQFCHISLDVYGSGNITHTKIQNHNCAKRVIVVKGEMLN
tara:strand:- start:4799 stop:5065 length:267 start_codon:yes stop_codon:yes gene_type:complete